MGARLRERAPRGWAEWLDKLNSAGLQGAQRCNSAACLAWHCIRQHWHTFEGCCSTCVHLAKDCLDASNDMPFKQIAAWVCMRVFALCGAFISLPLERMRVTCIG